MQDEKKKTYNAEYYKNHKEALNEAHEKWRKKNKEKQKEYWSNYYKEHKDQMKKTHDNWLKENKERWNEYRRKWYAENKKKKKIELSCVYLLFFTVTCGIILVSTYLN